MILLNRIIEGRKYKTLYRIQCGKLQYRKWNIEFSRNINGDLDVPGWCLDIDMGFFYFEIYSSVQHIKKDYTTYLALLNYYFLQFFFIRLTKEQTRVAADIKAHECSIVGAGQYEMGYSVVTWEIRQRWAIMYWVIPFSGYGKKFRYVNGCKYLNLTKWKKIDSFKSEV